MTERINAIKAGATEGAIEAAKMIPGVGILIESVRKYHETIGDQQREEFVDKISRRLEKIERNSDWYATDEGEQFVRKIVATALNAEYADKLEFLANALANGPELADDNTSRLKFVEMIRSLSAPALDVLVASLRQQEGAGQVLSGRLAAAMNWPPYLVDACVSELRSVGVYSSIVSWRKDRDGNYEKSSYLSGSGCARTEFTEQFVQFITSPEVAV